MNKFVLMLQKKQNSNLPKVGQFGELLVLLSQHAKILTPPKTAQFDSGLNFVDVETDCCADCLVEKIKDVGFEVKIGHTEGNKGECHGCDCHTVTAA